MTDKVVNRNAEPNDIFGMNPVDDCILDTTTHVSSVIPFPAKTSRPEIKDITETPSHVHTKPALASNKKPFTFPSYRDIQFMACDMASNFAEPGSEIYDIGCSSGDMMLYLHHKVGPDVSLVGADHSVKMLKKAQTKLKNAKMARPWKLVKTDIQYNLPIVNASVVTMLCLPFTRPLYSRQTMRRIYQGLNKGGCVIFTEKSAQKDPRINRICVDHSYDSKLSDDYQHTRLLATKRQETFENAFLPGRFEESRKLLMSMGFSAVEEFFRWYNFCGIIAIK